MTTTSSTPANYQEALVIIADAKARGGRVLCGRQCGREATLVLVCENGTFQGVGCQQCWDAHHTMMEASKVLEASGLAEPFCSRCNAESPGVDHIRTEPI